MNVESIIKGRIAGLVVSLMFQEAGYFVFRYGYEGIAGSLVQVGKLKKQKVLELLDSTPHFVVADREQGRIFLISVRFYGSVSSGRNIPWGYGELAGHWPEAYLLTVRANSPYFGIVTKDGGRLRIVPLGEAGIFKIKTDEIKKYGRIARKFLA